MDRAVPHVVEAPARRKGDRGEAQKNLAGAAPTDN
jgi:hypothetical protein